MQTNQPLQKKHHIFRLIFVIISVLGKLPTIERDHNDYKIVLLEACRNFPTNEYPRKLNKRRFFLISKEAYTCK